MSISTTKSAEDHYLALLIVSRSSWPLLCSTRDSICSHQVTLTKIRPMKKRVEHQPHHHHHSRRKEWSTVTGRTDPSATVPDSLTCIAFTSWNPLHWGPSCQLSGSRSTPDVAMNDHLGGKAQQPSESTSALDMSWSTICMNLSVKSRMSNINASHLTETFNLIYRFKLNSNRDEWSQRVCLCITWLDSRNGPCVPPLFTSHP